jgi:hypothetical protein
VFDIEELHALADNYLIPCWNRKLPELIVDKEKSHESIKKWLRQSGLKVNKKKFKCAGSICSMWPPL